MNFLMSLFNGLLALFTGLMAFFSYRLWKTSKEQGDILKTQGEILYKQLQEVKSSDMASFYLNLDLWKFEIDNFSLKLYGLKKDDRPLYERANKTYEDLIISLQKILPKDDCRIKTLMESKEKLVLSRPHLKEPKA